MPVERSVISSSHHVPEIGKFIIHPEYLDDDEIQYELTIRSEVAIGNRRELTARLRTLIDKEQSGERVVPITAYSVPSEEMKHCENQIPVLRNVMGMVDQEISSQNRFMTKFLHIEGRLNRIPKQNTLHDITGGVFAVNE